MISVYPHQTRQFQTAVVLSPKRLHRGILSPLFNVVVAVVVVDLHVLYGLKGYCTIEV